jgi:hypothetical protein
MGKHDAIDRRGDVGRYLLARALRDATVASRD